MADSLRKQVESLMSKVNQTDEDKEHIKKKERERKKLYRERKRLEKAAAVTETT